MSYEQRFDKVMELSRSLQRHKESIVDFAVRDLSFTVKDSRKEVDITIDRLKMYEDARDFLQDRIPLGGPGSRVSLMLSYNGSAWLNTAITSIYMVGNRVSVKFSSKGHDVMALTEEMYQPIFGNDITFYRGTGRNFIEESLKDPKVSTVIVFGFDEHVMPYQEAFQKSGKKLVFEGPGQDPFIVFPDADVNLALEDLVTSKFMYSGQTCNAPKRIYIHQSIYEEFLGAFVNKTRQLAVGDPADENTDVSPVASDLAVRRIATQLEEAVRKGAEIALGGRIEGNLIQPTVVKNATDDMLGMREEVFGPVAFTSSFAGRDEVVARAGNHKYGLRAAVFGGRDARAVADALKGEDYCHPVPDYTFGRFGTVVLNETRNRSWQGAFIVNAVGGYGYSGWIWETVHGRFRIKQGPKLLSIETSLPAEPESA
jgi:betaine-aldehyde dehydrogenase